MKLLHVVGARPNFMKAAPVMAALSSSRAVTQQLAHTGQHYDQNMSGIFFQQLGLPTPDYNLEVGSGSHAQQTAEIMLRFEKLLLAETPDLLLVYGDVNSTIAAALVASKMGVRVGHVEAGLRSWDRSMPEEINRVLTDQISDLFFTTSKEADANLVREGISPMKVFCVGNVMIDTLVRLLPKSQEPKIAGRQDRFLLVTLHRPSNVDAPDMLSRLWNVLSRIGKDIQVIFPVHPRTRQRLKDCRLAALDSHVVLTDPLGYLEFLWLQQHAIGVVTDSGGIQEETTYLQIPCITMRQNTERPITVELGTNILVGQDTDRLENEIARILNGQAKKGSMPPLWDGCAGQRIANIISGSEAQSEPCYHSDKQLLSCHLP
jgi:UDP-N-acetylglucosamine 2-epimerase (non-hydrolysing)